MKNKMQFAIRRRNFGGNGAFHLKGAGGPSASLKSVTGLGFIIFH